MKKILINTLVIFSLLLFICSCNRPIRYDLIVENASIFNTKTGKVTPRKTILINADTIAGIIDANEPVRTKKVVDADGRLVTPGNIDTHIRFEDAIYSTNKNSDNHPKILTTFYRNRFSKNYLPYGVTTTLDLGSPNEWAEQIMEWQTNPKFSDILASQTITNIGQAGSSTADFTDDLAKQLELSKAKYIYIQDYWKPEKFEKLKTLANAGKLIIFVKPTFRTSNIEDLGNIEHIYSPILNTIEKSGSKNNLAKQIENVYGKNYPLPEAIYALEAFKYTVENNPQILDSLITLFGKHHISISTTLHVLAEYGDITPFKNFENNSWPKLPKELKHRISYNFNHLLTFVKKLHESGVTLRIGTDRKNGGMAFISEQLLLAEAGIAAADIIRISTLNAATTLGIDSKYGAIEVGKKADLVIYDEDPLYDPKNFAATRRVIKDGKLYKKNGAKLGIEE
ncbi:MAG: amidohydrolase family protein [Bacteroidales bacterium]